MDKIYVRFHVGRGGRFNNQGHLSFVNEDNFQDLIKVCGNLLECVTEDYDWETDTTTPLDESKWHLEDSTCGRILIEGREAMEADTGILDWDGDYDKDIVTTTDELTQKQEDCLWEAYLEGAYMSDELKDEICTLKDKKRVHYIKCYQTNLECFFQSDTTDGCSSCAYISFYGLQGELTREEWKEKLTEEGFCPFSVEKILDVLDSCYTEDLDFFKEEED